jgi:putative ABC transport system permease protein
MVSRPAAHGPGIGAFGGRLLVFQALVGGPLRERPGRALLALAAIALGVALGVAVHLINASAVREFSVAAHHLAGEASLVVRGPRSGFDEALYPRIARMREVEAANPALELDAPLADERGTLKIVGLDSLRAAQVQPSLLPGDREAIAGLLDDDAILLSPAAAEWLNRRTGDTVNVLAGSGALELKIAGLLPSGAYRQRVAVMDIARAQWRLDRLGRLNRIDLKLRPGVDVGVFQRTLQQSMPPGVQVTTPDAEAARGASLTRAYRLNLDMLALITLFTGAFLVFSSQVLALIRRRAQFALTRVLGVTRGALAWLLAAEAAILGAIGSAFGVALGVAVARYALAEFGADLGAGYFRSIAPALHVDAYALTAYFMLGVAFAVSGAVGPALEAARRPPALGLRAGDVEDALKRAHAVWPGLTLMSAGGLTALAPPVAGLPIAGYLSIFLLLIGFIVLLPRLADFGLRRLPTPRPAFAALAVGQLQATPRQVAISVAAIVTSFSLMVAMLIMVHSFRTSLDRWLTQMLPADLYVRVQRGGETGFLTPEEQVRLAATPGVRQIDFLRSQNLLLDPRRPAVTLLAGAAATAERLPLTGRAISPGAGDPPPVWASEVAADIYGWRAGDVIELPIDNRGRRFTVAGIWRDYARQNGAVAITRDLYVELTGDRLANDAAVWIAPGTSLNDAARALRARLENAPGSEITATGEMRAASLALFDRTFAVTYALEAAAVVIGLFGISVSFGAQALARRREFGMLRHLGMTRHDIARMLGVEGMLVSGLGVGAGLALGWIVSLVLVHVVNRQSFHWSMEIAVPWLALFALAATLVCAAIATAVWSGRAAMDDEVVRAVREDW